MNALKNMPFWIWFVVVTVVCYAIWNPTGYSMYDLWKTPPLEARIFLKLFISFILGAIIFFFLATTMQTIGTFGVIVYVIFLGITVGLLNELGWITLADLASAKYWPQPVVALMLTIGLLFEKIRFAITGIRTVDNGDE